MTLSDVAPSIIQINPWPMRSGGEPPPLFGIGVGSTPVLSKQQKAARTTRGLRLSPNHRPPRTRYIRARLARTRRGRGASARHRGRGRGHADTLPPRIGPAVCWGGLCGLRLRGAFAWGMWQSCYYRFTCALRLRPVRHAEMHQSALHHDIHLYTYLRQKLLEERRNRPRAECLAGKAWS